MIRQNPNPTAPGNPPAPFQPIGAVIARMIDYALDKAKTKGAA